MSSTICTTKIAFTLARNLENFVLYLKIVGIIDMPMESFFFYGIDVVKMTTFDNLTFSNNIYIFFWKKGYPKYSYLMDFVIIISYNRESYSFF